MVMLRWIRFDGCFEILFSQVFIQEMDWFRKIFGFVMTSQEIDWFQMLPPPLDTAKIMWKESRQ
jgi:hypothetical protein